MSEKYVKLTETEREKLSRAIEAKFGSESRVSNGGFIALLCDKELEAA
jgi:hypothetical protein